MYDQKAYCWWCVSSEFARVGITSADVPTPMQMASGEQVPGSWQSLHPSSSPSTPAVVALPSERNCRLCHCHRKDLPAPVIFAFLFAFYVLFTFHLFVFFAIFVFTFFPCVVYGCAHPEVTALKHRENAASGFQGAHQSPHILHKSPFYWRGWCLLDQ